MIKKSKNLKEILSNNLMKNGNKKTSEKIILKTFKKLQKETSIDHLHLIKQSIINTAPIIKLKEIKKKRRKTKKYLPYVLNKKKRVSISVKNIITNINPKITTTKSLKNEILLATKNEGGAIKRKTEYHESAILKKKYAFFRWFF